VLRREGEIAASGGDTGGIDIRPVLLRQLHTSLRRDAVDFALACISKTGRKRRGLALGWYEAGGWPQSKSHGYGIERPYRILCSAPDRPQRGFVGSRPYPHLLKTHSSVSGHLNTRPGRFWCLRMEIGSRPPVILLTD
jgi:hypothetical protein